MGALNYLYLTSMKNDLKQLKHRPSKLITLLIIAVLGLVLFTVRLDDGDAVHQFRDMSELCSLILVIYTLVFVMESMRGLSSRASFYSMADIHYLFPSPISPKLILGHGLVKQSGTTILIGLFLLFQYNWLKQTYNLSFMSMIVICIGYGFTALCSKLTALTIYAFTNSKMRSISIIKAWLILVSIVLAIYILFPAMQLHLGILPAIVEQANAAWLELIPIAGWLKAAAAGWITADHSRFMLGFTAACCYLLLLVFLLLKVRSDYYEDVLQESDTAFNSTAARKQGMAAEDLPARIRVGRTGIKHGQGADVFFYKHLLEFRRSGRFYVNISILIVAVICFLFALFFKVDGITPVFIFATYVQIFSSTSGRWLKELLMPYVYLVPVHPFNKLIAICKKHMLLIAIEALIVFIPAGLVLQATFEEIAICIIARIGFGFLFMAGNILMKRLTGANGGKVLLIMLYFVLMIILALPGLAAGIGLAMLLPDLDSLFTILGAAFLWNMIISSLIILTCKNIIQYTELNNR